MPALFKGRHFDRLLIIQSVRWYITYKLSYRDVCEMMAECGVTLVHTTVMRWVRPVDNDNLQEETLDQYLDDSERTDQDIVNLCESWDTILR